MDNLLTDDPNDLLTGDDKILAQAKGRFLRCEEWESTARRRFVDDMKFANADADNQFQWPNKIATERQVAARPTLTVNKTRQHCLQIINDAKQNKPSVNIRPTSGGATYEAAQVFEGIVRHIEYISNAETAYDTATSFQVQGGWGYWRVVTDYVSDDSFDQEIFIRRVKDPLSIYLDPDIREQDGSDARFGFVFEDMPIEQFKQEYPDYKDAASRNPLGNNEGWLDEEHIRVAEYYRVSPKKDRLIAMNDPNTGEETVLRESEIPPELRKEILDDPATKTREILDPQIEWFKIAGDTIIDRKTGKDCWPGKFIPLVRVIGEETIIEGKLDRKGHTRAMIDPQRMVNYWTSAATEFVALQSKSPFVAPARSIEGYETYWDTANTSNASILPYNDVTDGGDQINGKPERAQPPVMATAYIEGLRMAYDQLMMVSGQYQANLGEQSNERSGKAIAERQRQGDNATYHFIDNLAMAIRYTGKILVDLIPKIYDTPRIIRIMGEDGTETEVQLDPSHAKAYAEQKAKRDEAVKAIFNPNVGRYDVESDVGPGYATKRQEAWNAFTQIASQDPALMSVIGDLMFKNADFPGADEIAERMKRMVPAQALGEEAPPQLMQAQQQIQKLSKLLEAMTQQLAEAQLKVKGKEADERDRTQQKAIDWEKMITDRIKVLLPTMLSPAQIADMHHDLAMQEHAAQIDMLATAHEAQVNDTYSSDAPQPQQAA